MLSLAKNRNESHDVIKYYMKEATGYKVFLSYRRRFVFVFQSSGY
jgi:hypothetical protein